MKKHLFLFTALLFAGVANAQPEKGDRVVIGSLSANYTGRSINDNRNFEFGGVNVQPLDGIFISKNYAIGFGVHYSNFFRTDYGLLGSKVTRSATHSVGPILFARHFTKIAEKLYMRTGTNAEYGVTFNRNRDFILNTITPWDKSNTFDVRVRFGLVYFPKPNIGIEFSYGEIGYNVQFAHVISGGPKQVTHNFNFKYGVDGIQISLYYLMKKADMKNMMMRHKKKGESTDTPK